MSPSPASPTEGDDLCETDVSNVAIHSVTLLICLCGLAGNGAVICLLSLKTRNYSILHVAFADFLFLLFAVSSAFLFLVEDLSCSPIMPLIYLSFVSQLSEISAFWGLFQLMLTSYEANILDHCKLYCSCNIPDRLWFVMGGAGYWAFFALFTVIPTLTSLCPSHKQGYCPAALISIYAVTVFLFAAPMVITRTIEIIRAMCGSRKQQLKWRDIVVSLVKLFTLLLVLCNFLKQLSYIPTSSEVVLLFTCINSSIKPFIYFLAGRCWSPCSMESLRLSLQRVFEEEKENTAHSVDAITDTGL